MLWFKLPDAVVPHLLLLSYLVLAYPALYGMSLPGMSLPGMSLPLWGPSGGSGTASGDKVTHARR